jgi:hypothetical protein
VIVRSEFSLISGVSIAHRFQSDCKAIARRLLIAFKATAQRMHSN